MILVHVLTICLFSNSNFRAPFRILCPTVPATQYPGIMTYRKIYMYTHDNDCGNDAVLIQIKGRESSTWFCVMESKKYVLIKPCV